MFIYNSSINGTTEKIFNFCENNGIKIIQTGTHYCFNDKNEKCYIPQLTRVICTATAEQLDQICETFKGYTSLN